jgi:hypothetical protein
MVVNSKNHRPTMFTRFVVYPLVLVFFLFILGYVLMLANGYKPTYKNNKFSFVKTGMIIAGTKPGDAKIYINGVYKKRTTLPFLTVKISGLVPDTYNIRIEKTGFRTWQNNLKVVTDLVTWANYVLLFPVDLKFEDFEIPKYKEITGSRNGRHILFSNLVDDKFSLISFDVQTKNEKNIWPTQGLENYPWLKSPVIKSASYSVNNDKILLVVDNAGVNEYVVLETGIGESRYFVFKTQEGFRETIKSVLWLENDNNRISFNTTKGLFLNTSNFDLDLNQPVIDGEVISFNFINQNDLLYIKKDADTKLISLNRRLNNNNTVIDSSLVPSQNYVLDESFDSKYVSVLNNDKKELAIYYNEAGKFKSTLLSDTAIGYFWNKNESKLAYFSDKKVMTYDFIKNVETAFEASTNIKQISWYFDESHFLINDGSLYVVDYDGANKVEIDEAVVMAIYDKINNNILILDEINNQGIKKYKKYISSI